MAEKYKYKLEDKSVTQRWLTDHVWVPLARHIPPWIRPNTITAAGAVFMLGSLVFVRLALGGNRWGCLGAALCTLLYFTCDNVDGPHARRTGQSSHLGEFLDHWLDSFNGAVLTMGVALCLGVHGPLLLLYVAGVSLSYFATIWEQHHTGTFHSEWLGSNEAIIVGSGAYLLLFAFHGSPWLTFQQSWTNPVVYLTIFAGSVSWLTLFKVLYRTHQKLLSFLPMALTTVVLLVLAVSEIISAPWAAAGMLAANAMFSGSLLIDRLTGIKSHIRGMVASGASMLCLALALVRPEPLSGLLGHHAFLLTVTLLVGVIMCWDLFRATRALGAQTRRAS